MERKRGYKYRAYPTKEQREFFSKNFGCCRFVYNHYLAKRKATWEEWHDTMSFSETSRDLANDLKKEKEVLIRIVQMSQALLQRTAVCFFQPFLFFLEFICKLPRGFTK